MTEFPLKTHPRALSSFFQSLLFLSLLFGLGEQAKAVSAECRDIILSRASNGSLYDSEGRKILKRSTARGDISEDAQVRYKAELSDSLSGLGLPQSYNNFSSIVGLWAKMVDPYNFDAAIAEIKAKVSEHHSNGVINDTTVSNWILGKANPKRATQIEIIGVISREFPRLRKKIEDEKDVANVLLDIYQGKTQSRAQTMADALIEIEVEFGLRETAEAMGIDPNDYQYYILRRVAKDIDPDLEFSMHFRERHIENLLSFLEQRKFKNEEIESNDEITAVEEMARILPSEEAPTVEASMAKSTPKKPEAPRAAPPADPEPSPAASDPRSNDPERALIEQMLQEKQRTGRVDWSAIQAQIPELQARQKFLELELPFELNPNDAYEVSAWLISTSKANKVEADKLARAMGISVEDLEKIERPIAEDPIATVEQLVRAHEFFQKIEGRTSAAPTIQQSTTTNEVVHTRASSPEAVSARDRNPENVLSRNTTPLDITPDTISHDVSQWVQQEFKIAKNHGNQRTSKQFAEFLQVSPQTVVNIRNGKFDVISVERIAAIEKFFDRGPSGKFPWRKKFWPEGVRVDYPQSLSRWFEQQMAIRSWDSQTIIARYNSLYGITEETSRYHRLNRRVVDKLMEGEAAHSVSIELVLRIKHLFDEHTTAL